MRLPVIIQGGMGAGVSNWRLAQAVSRTGQLGVISGTALDLIFTRRLQDGDPGGHMRRALDHFPIPEIAERLYKRYYVPGGKDPQAPYAAIPISTPYPSRFHQEMLMVANFVEVWLAREGHDNPVGLNLLEKIQFPNVISIYGAMLAGVDYVLMGAGIPREIPGVIDLLTRHETASIRMAVDGALSSDDYRITFNPREVIPAELPELKRPSFLAIIASYTLALTLMRKSTGRVDGFVVEDHTAGGHNAPPRGGIHLNERNEPVWGPKDEIEVDKIRDLGQPYWIAGRCSSPAKLAELRRQGAAGIQVGTFFAFCKESGLDEALKRTAIENAVKGECQVFTDPLASPTGFPFKVLQMKGTLSEKDTYELRPRRCDLGYLRRPYRLEDGTLGFRCTAEPEEEHVRKGGNLSDTVGRKCLCNALLSNISLAQVQSGNDYRELPLLTAGEELENLTRLVSPEKKEYSAAEVVHYLISDTP